MESGAVVCRGGRLWLVLNGLSGAAPVPVGNGSGAVFHRVALAGDVERFGEVLGVEASAGTWTLPLRVVMCFAPQLACDLEYFCVKKLIAFSEA